MGEIEDLKFRHVVWPTAFAIILVQISAYTYEVHRFPPMMLALILAIVTSPLLCKLTNSGVVKEHAIGLAMVCFPMAILWAIGESYFNIAIPFMVWVWQSASWSKRDQPPIKYGVWHGFGIAFGIIPGAMIFDFLFY